MIIEFTGCSGAGKTMLLQEVQKQLQLRGETAGPPTEILLGWALKSIHRRPRLSNLAIEIAAIPDFIRRQTSSRPSTDDAFRNFSLKTIDQVGQGFGERLRLLRSTTRKLTLDKKLRENRFQNRIVLVDEGIIHLAHVLLGRYTTGIPLAACQQFSKLAPRPHLLVWVKAAPELAEKRIDARGAHRPLPDRSFEERKKFIRNADAILENAIGQTDSEDWVIKIENNRQDKEELRNHANRVAEAILRRRAA